ncbi:lytic transglycosylase domain-containing protein [Cellulomonas alba]|uniref:LysM peptidoglycan-binding domain-containing protein n=1 Tax=Cellulomonas alba TaxID=3053467 RepID=A0ABT7SDE8_9CELL|nr:lytic transglycosylase domain-containing protein [Cellulomonas alba]MDM7853592.1 LysM peptidoglycan-binding domain-containing protein [Cellulomonas alba]
MPNAAARPDALRRAATGTGATIALAAVAVTTSAGAAHAADRYTVRPGDTVSHIAARTGTTVAAISHANALHDPGRILVGQVLTIPSTAARTPAAHHGPTVTRTPATHYAVRAGDTVSAIAKRHGTTVAAVVKANHLDHRAFIRIGQVLTIPGKAVTSTAGTQAPAARPTSTTTTYTVVAGDTLTRIAAQHRTTVAELARLNHVRATAMIRIGQKLQVPGKPQAQLVGSTFAGRTYSSSVVAAANANLAALRSQHVPSRAAVQAMVASTARSLGVDPALAQAIAYQESGFNAAVVSPANAIGVMQVIPSSGEWASEMVGRKLDLLEPRDNVVAGVAILRALVHSAPDVRSAIAGYYQGLSSVRKNGMFADTRRYVANVQTLMVKFR